MRMPTIAVLVVGVAASQGVGAACIIRVTACGIIANIALVGAIIFIDAVSMLLGSGLVVIVIVAVAVVAMSVGMSVVVIVGVSVSSMVVIMPMVTMSTVISVIVSSGSMVVLGCSRGPVARLVVLLGATRTAVGTHFGRGRLQWARVGISRIESIFFVLFDFVKRLRRGGGKVENEGDK